MIGGRRDRRDRQARPGRSPLASSVNSDCSISGQTIGETLRGVRCPGLELDAIEMQRRARPQVERIADGANDLRGVAARGRWRRQLGNLVECERQHLQRRAGHAAEAGWIGIEADVASGQRTDEQAHRVRRR